MEEWISVKDKLPENGGKYLCIVKIHKIPDIRIRQFSSWGYGNRLRWWNNNGSEDLNVTHWMSLPEMPNEDL